MKEHDIYAKVEEFTKAMEQPIGVPFTGSAPLVGLRQKLINEEFIEVDIEISKIIFDICDGQAISKELKANLTKELADLMYVIVGMATTFGLPLKEVFNRVHESNMSKLDDNGKPVYREDGKILKSDNYIPPQLEDLF